MRSTVVKRLLQNKYLPSPGTWIAPARTQRQAVVVGAGHNGLIAAAYLAKNGVDVLVLERRDVVGGAAVTEELFSGVKYSRASYVAGLLRPKIVKELGLEKHGFRYLPRETSSFTPCDPQGADAGKFLRFCSDADSTHQSISQFSQRDADQFALYEEHIAKCRDLLPSLIDSPLPDIGAWHRLSAMGKRNVLVGLTRMLRDVWPHRDSLLPFLQLLTQPATRVLDSWFESDILKATLACDACIGNGASVSEPGSGYALMHLVMGETLGRPGVWSYLEGGMGALSDAVMKSAMQNGVEICTNAEVVEFSLSNESDKGPKVNGVVMKDGTRIQADVVLSNATPFHTFLELLPSDALDQESKRALRSHDYSGGAMKINCVTNALPEFTCWPTHGTIGPPHLGTIHFEDSVSQLQTAAAQAACGVPAERPLIEMAIPTSVDGTLAPAGQHVVQFFVQYTPYHLKTGKWDDLKQKYADKVFGHVERYCPGFSDSVLHRDVLSPLDLERIFGLHEGNIYHGAHRIDQIAFWRPAVGFASHRTPVKNLYMCGAGCHPGGGVMGAAGRNAASVVLRDIKHT